MKPDHDASLRQHLLELLKGGSAHARFEDAIAGIPAKLKGTKPAGFPHSPWMLLEHMRIAQWDILEFSRNRKHVSPDWPKGYWPRSDGEKPRSGGFADIALKKENGARFRCPSLSVETQAMGRGPTATRRMR